MAATLLVKAIIISNNPNNKNRIVIFLFLNTK